MTASDEELEEDVFRKRKAELISAATGAAAGELRLCLNDTLIAIQYILKLLRKTRGKMCSDALLFT